MGYTLLAVCPEHHWIPEEEFSGTITELQGAQPSRAAFFAPCRVSSWSLAAALKAALASTESSEP